MAQQPPASLGVQRLQVKPFCGPQLPSGSTELTEGLFLVSHLSTGTEGTHLAWGHLCPPVQEADKADARKIGC